MPILGPEPVQVAALGQEIGQVLFNCTCICLVVGDGAGGPFCDEHFPLQKTRLIKASNRINLTRVNFLIFVKILEGGR